VHFTPANLVSKFHRSIEPPQTTRTLRAIFRDEARFAVHAPIPGGQALGDEGAANHTRFAPTHGRRGLHFFVYGHRAFASASAAPSPQRFASRQSCEAAEAIARCHVLSDKQVSFAQQHSEAIDAGVFHNDVISVGNENVFFYHERAFVNTPAVIRELRRRYTALHRKSEFIAVPVSERRVPLADAVRSYLFNSQLVTTARGRMALIAPIDCAETTSVRAFLDDLIARAKTPITAVHYLDLKQSMRNGGGPACLRLRVVLTPEELAALPPRVILKPATHAALTAWVQQHYRDKLTAADLADPHLLEETRRALDQLTQLLGLGSIYPFQLTGA
jgi:succinylarginine dihydrolase